MDNRSDIELLRDYVEGGSEDAFAAIVARHLDLVFSAALRQVRNAHLAQEVTQATFLVLARKARRLDEHTVLSAWLYRTARFAAADALKLQARRIQYEQEAAQMEPDQSEGAWNEVAPHLDEAMSHLSEKDRVALLLRFFENKSLREVGAALGTNEDSAQKRVSRALLRLREYFVGRGAVVSGTTLATLLQAHAVQAAPGHVASAITAVSLPSGAVSASTLTLVKQTLKMIMLKKLQSVAAIAAAVVVTGGTATLLAQKAKRTPASAGQTAPATLRSPKDALRYLADALTAYEGDKVVESYLTDGPAQRRFVKAMAEVVTREGQFLKAVADKFGERPVNDLLARHGGPIFSFNFGQDGLDLAEEQIDGDKATVRLPNRHDPAKPNVIELRRPDGVWKVYAGPTSPASGDEDRIALSFERAASTLQKVTADIRADQFKGFADLMRALHREALALARP